jgi:hypothetical protein
MGFGGIVRKTKAECVLVLLALLGAGILGSRENLVGSVVSVKKEKVLLLWNTCRGLFVQLGGS